MDNTQKENAEFKRRVSDSFSDEILNRLTRLEENYAMTNKTVDKLGIIVENSVGLIERFERTLDKMANTLAELNITMVQINQRVNDNEKDIVKVEKSVNEVEKEVRTLDGKGKIDFMEFIKNNFAKFVFGGGFLYLVFFWVDHILDTYLSIIIKK